MDGLDLYQTFYDLNSRINNILNSTSNMHLEPDSSIATSDSLVERFAQRVVHIRVRRSDYLDATRFLNVHSLEFYDYLPQQQLEQIRPECFAHLVYLRMCYIDDSVVASTFFQRIFSNEFPSLHKCVLDELTPPDSSQQWLGSPSLRSLSARGFALPLYSYILNSCSNLTHLHWSTIRCADVDNEATLVRHTHLKRLYIRTINIQIIETILFHVSNLKRLYIVSDWSRGNNCLPLDFKRLAHILIRYVPSLNCFDCDTMERNPIDIDTIHGFHPCFIRIQIECVPDGRIRFFTIK